MTLFEAIIQGVLQGITEFLPVSSSAHLKLCRMLMGIEKESVPVIFDLACHTGTLIAALWAFRKDIFTILFHDQKKILLICLAILPLVPFYFFMKPFREFLSETRFLGFALMTTSLILFTASSIRKKMESWATPKVSHALVIGTMQATALIPGISRSASTISAAKALGWSMPEAVRFSFLLSIPTIMGGNLLESLSLLKHGSTLSLDSSFLYICLLALITSFLTGQIVIRYALRVLEKGMLKPFAWYCLIIGCITTIYLNFISV